MPRPVGILDITGNLTLLTHLAAWHPPPSHTNAFPESPSTAIIAHYPRTWPFPSALFQPWELTPVTKLQHPVPEILEPALARIPTGFRIYCASIFAVNTSFPV